MRKKELDVPSIRKKNGVKFFSAFFLDVVIGIQVAAL